jgi:hypothetical protein
VSNFFVNPGELADIVFIHGSNNYHTSELSVQLFQTSLYEENGY